MLILLVENHSLERYNRIWKHYLNNSTIQSIYVTTNASLPDRIKLFVDEISKFSPNTGLVSNFN